MTENELISVAQREIKGLSTNFDVADYQKAVDSAERDTGFSLPATDPFRIKWLLERTKRHLLFMLLLENTESFKFKQINLQQVFTNMLALIKEMDLAFAAAMLENPAEFAGVESFEMFGHKIDAGFAYEEETGRDLTYLRDQLVIITPGDSE